ncbi:hypothetical protein [Mesorhizobium sp. M1322]|uniref:hypothetical protein n=1 Tax=Mesorhizobium sp. M1322 TaxID=2957081 RepID=UPI003337441E
MESLNTRAGNLIFATAFVSSLLGGRALLDGLGLWDWLALALLFLIGLLVVIMLWPYYAFTFRFDPEQLLQDFVDKNPSGTIDVMHRALALRIVAGTSGVAVGDNPSLGSGLSGQQGEDCYARIYRAKAELR